MKRALAERAKQQSIPQAAPPPSRLGGGGSSSGSHTTTTSSPEEPRHHTQPPPSKIPRLQVPPTSSNSKSTSLKRSNSNSNSNKGVSTTTSSSNRIHKSSSNSAAVATPNHVHSSSSSLERSNRIKALTSAVSASSNNAAADATEESNAFYLKHQNRALATELNSLQFAVSQLEHERDYRRQQCSAACQALNSLQATWTQLETALSNHADAAASTRSSTTPSATPSSSTSSTLLPHESTPPAATGMTDSVEWTRALAHALASLGSSSCSSKQQAPPATSVEQLYADISNLSANVADRASVLQEHIWKHLQQQQRQQQQNSASSAPQQPPQAVPSSADGNAQNNANSNETATAAAQDEVLRLQNQVAELSAARDAVTNRERKLRRNVYRLAAGMLTAEQVVRTLDTSTEKDGSNQSAENDSEEMRRQVQAEAAAAAAASSSSSQPTPTMKKEEDGQLPLVASSSSRSGDQQKGGTTATAVAAAAAAASGVSSVAQAERWQGQIADLQKSVANREETIQDLNAKLKEKELEINRLTVRQQSDEDGEKLKSLQVTKLKLESKEKTVKELESKLAETRKEWANTLGNEKRLQVALEEQVGKFEKRWSEFTNALDSRNNTDATTDAAVAATGETTAANDSATGTETEAAGVVPSLAEQVSQSKRIIELQHKLNQAVENVRQAESTRSDLTDALQMNKQLQSELEEVKGKYAALQASRAAAAAAAAAAESGNANNTGGGSSSGPTSSSKDAEPSSSSKSSSSDRPSSSGGGGGGSESSSKYERMHRDYRRARKELAAMTASKDSAKSKLERSEKERENLVETNARLLRQSTEKDEMNAKSLATILHLKSLTEQLTAERGNLEQQLKSASQLALAARLATNAKERLSEEAAKEKQQFEQKCQQLEQDHTDTKTELAKIKHDRSEETGQITSLSTQLANAIKRSDELVTENQSKADEIRNLRDSTDKAEREAHKATEKLNALQNSTATTNNNSSQTGGGGGGGSSGTASAFTVDQLNTQISVLKSRLACPVCHYRDKECIIMRCRHMHCKQCVDERISNRSRKCPTCNNKFSEKDVEDVWLS